MRLRLSLTVLTLFLFVLGACQNPTTTNRSGRLRASLESSNEVSPRLRVWVEGSSGLFLTGALVRFIAPTGEASVLTYSATSGCFEAMVGADDGTFRVEASSLAWDELRSLSLEHQSMRNRPNLLVVSDGVGDALLGATLGANLELTLGWNPIAVATSSFVQIVQSGVVRWSTTVAGSLATVPAGALAAGHYSARVTSQFLAGDPLFESSAYYSTSHAQSIAVQFELQ